MTCPSCGGTAPDGSRFCPSCGRALLATEAATVLVDTSVAQQDPAMTVLTDPGLTIAASSAARDVSYAPGDVVATRYRIDRLLGRGGMGVVYQAFDQRLGQPVALKFLPPSLARDPRRLAQFHSEVRLARQISHPHVCRVYDIGDADGHLFLSMEYIDGRDLAAVLASQGRYAERDAVDLLRQIASGLAAVHGAGVLHRDLKPANVMVKTGGEAVLMDFGIAEAGDLDASERITEGTPHYMAPEQLRGEAASIASDIYAFGLVMFEVFTGRRLFDARTTRELADQQSRLGSDVPAGLEIIAPPLREAVQRCLHPDPAKRPASSAEAASMLQVVLLEAVARGRRLFQIFVQGTPTVAGLFILAMLARGGTSAILTAAVLAALVAALIVIEFRFPLGWTVTYKGHTIRFWNHPLWGERLLIDGTLADKGRFGVNITLRGTIERGAGAGERITADVKCGLSSLSCRIVAEAFAAAPATAGSSA